MRQRSVRQTCLALLRRLDIPDPFDMGTFAGVVGEDRGRPVRLLAKAGSDGPCGVSLVTEKADYVFYEADTGPFHRDHIVLHELGHLLLRHDPVAVTQLDDACVLRDADGRVLAGHCWRARPTTIGPNTRPR